MMRRLVIEEPVSRAAIWGLRFALFSVPVFLAGVVLTRRGGGDLAAGLAVIGSATAIALIALVLGILALAQIWREGRKGLRSAIQALLIAGLVLALPAFFSARLLFEPYLADLSTDPTRPPAFSFSSTALAARSGIAPSAASDNIPVSLLAAAGLSPDNPRGQAITEEAEFVAWLNRLARDLPLPITDPAKLRSMQRRAYPEFTSLRTDLRDEEAFNRAVKAAEDQGWTIVDRTPPGGRFGLGHIDAVHQTGVLRLPIDITVRLRTHTHGTIIDVRSIPRYRLLDFGTGPGGIIGFMESISPAPAAADD